MFDRWPEEDDYTTRRIHIELALYGADIALPDAGRSELAFGAPKDGGGPYADLALSYADDSRMPELSAGEFPRREPSSFVWLGLVEKDTTFARLDLSRARLTASRDVDLVNLRFRFRDLALMLTAGQKPKIRPLHEDCRVIETGQGEFRDDRPALSVEFDPQHLFEEALFAQFLQLPDAVNEKGEPGRNEILADLDRLRGNVQALVEYRKQKQTDKISKEKPPLPSPSFREAVANLPKPAGAPSEVPSDEELCKPEEESKFWRLVRKLCDRRQAGRTIREKAADAQFFRSVLDAYDRHELVLLSSAYGLPVIPKLKAEPGDDPNGRSDGDLTDDSGQIKPGDKFYLLDVEDAQAIQNPLPLRVTELSLSALGGSLTHDTQFKPSAGALDLYGGKVFDGFSIESWREEIVLGRDVVGEVVYKGYLFPFGHRASLVKLTERLFLSGGKLGVKAALVQRVFLRIGNKLRQFPAIGQPLQGRLWCAQNVTLRTGQSPDLMDPFISRRTGQTSDPEKHSGGRFDLSGGAGVAQAFTVPPTLDLQTEEDPDKLAKTDRLAEEAKVLADAAAFDKAAADANAKRIALTRFVQSWTAPMAQAAAPLQIADHIGTLAQEVLSGEITALIDISSFRDALINALSQLVPTSASFAYDFGSNVDEPPKENQIFQAQQGGRFALSTRIEVNLLNPGVKLTTKGEMGPFSIKLVGGFIDALTLNFGGAKFESLDGGAPRFDIAYQSYDVGPALAFIENLKPYLTPSDGAGFHIGPSNGIVGIEAGYGVNFGALSIGPVSFFNIIFDVTAILPFDGGPAVFKTSLGTRTTPFTISALPYAGSGYFSIYATARGIKGFEAGFMFGGGGSVRFGPLQAQVQVQVGAFFRVMKIDTDHGEVSVTEVAATFLAAGSACIWIFHFGASLYVALSQTNGGDMEGEATFTFSFSCGFIHYHYSVTAHHKQAKTGNNNQTSWLGDDGSRQYALANLPGRLSDADPDWLEIAAKCPPGAADADVASRAVCQSEDYETFASYFDFTLVPEAA